MQPATAWDWSPGKRVIWDLSQHSREAQWHEELYASPDGEETASIAKYGDEGFGICVNGQAKDKLFEKIWNLRYAPDGRLTAIVQEEMDWTLLVGEETWPEEYAFMWGVQFAGAGNAIAASVQQDGEYGMVLNGEAWETLFVNANNFALAPDGSSTAAVVQIRPIPQADIFTYKEGCYTVAVNGKVWTNNFVNCWTPVYDQAAKRVACQVRHTLYDYSIAVDGESWSKTFPCIWNPCFNPATGAVVAPVRMGGKWGMAQDGEVIWEPKYANCWHQQFSADGQNLWAIVAPKFGRWTLALNGKAWHKTFGSMVRDMVVSPDGKHAAAVGKDGEKYAVIANDTIWVGWYDMVWQPVFSSDSKHVAVKVERAGKRFTVVIDGQAHHEDYDQLWDPVFSPEGTKVMLRAVKDGKYCRIVIPVPSSHH